MDFLTNGSEFLAAHPNFKLEGRSEELKKLSSILMRSKAASVLLVGPGGVGSTALCMGLQASKDDPDAPFDIVEKRIYWLEVDKLFSSGDQTKINAAFQRVLSILKDTTDSVLMIEDTRDFIEAARNSGCMHFINSLNSAVKNGDTQAVLEVRDDDLDFVLKTHSDFKECYTMMDLNEPVGDALIAIAKNAADNLSKHHEIRIDEDAITTAIFLTNKYRANDSSLSRAQPERTSNLIDRSLSSYRLEAHRHTDPEDQVKFKRLYKDQREAEKAILKNREAIDKLKEEEAAALQRSDVVDESRISTDIMTQMSMGFDSPKVRKLKDEIKLYQAEADRNHTEFEAITVKINSKLLLTKEMVIEEFSKLSGIPASKLNEDEKVKLRGLEAKLNARVFGQEAGIAKIANAIKIARVGKRSSGEPQASFLIMGPSGVGKTEVSKALAAELLDSEAALTRFDMSEYMEKHAVAKLIGAPPGYEGFDVGGILTNAMRKNPYRVLLFDEIEKAHPDVFNVFLQILSDGRLTDNVGRTVSFEDAILIFTTNIGQPAFLNPDLSPEMAQLEAMKELNATYRPEFLNRFAGRENILCFVRLEMPSIERIIRREIDKINTKYYDDNISVAMNDASLNAFCVDRYDPTVGARGLPGYIKANLEPIIANKLLNSNDNHKSLANVQYTNKAFQVSIEAA